MPCSPAGTPVPSDARLAAVVLGKPAVNDRPGRSLRNGAASRRAADKVGAHPVDQQYRYPAHAVESEADPVGLPRNAEHAEHRGNQVGERAVAVARADEHSVSVGLATAQLSDDRRAMANG